MNTYRYVVMFLINFAFFLVSAPLLAETPHFPDEVFDAKSIAIITRFVRPAGDEPEGIKDMFRNKLAEKIRQKGRFQLVDDPTQADLVCLYLFHQPTWFHKKNHPERWWAGSLGSSVVILKGGASKNWDSVPVWMGSAASLAIAWPDHPKTLLGAFHKDLENAEKLKGRQSDAAKLSGTNPEKSASPQGSTRTNVYVTCLGWHCPKKAAAAIQDSAHRPGWNFVNDPSSAETIAVWFDMDITTFGSIGIVGITHSQKFGGLLLFKNTRPDWNTTPYTADIGPNAYVLFQRFVDSLPTL
jgi:hypothetical protein